MKDDAMSMTMDMTRFIDEKWIWLLQSGYRKTNINWGPLIEAVQVYLSFWGIIHNKSRKDKAPLWQLSSVALHKQEELRSFPSPKRDLRRAQNR